MLTRTCLYVHLQLHEITHMLRRLSSWAEDANNSCFYKFTFNIFCEVFFYFGTFSVFSWFFWFLFVLTHSLNSGSFLSRFSYLDTDHGILCHLSLR